MHFDERYVEKAFWESAEKGQYIAVLSRLAFVGIEKQRMYQQVKDFLWAHNIPFASNSRGMIWLEACDENLMAFFSKED